MQSRSCLKIDDSVIASGFLDSFDYVLTDCDGVLWVENNLIPGSLETIKALKKKGKHIIYVTNNSTKCREDHLKKLKSLGFPATLEDIISSSYCVATYLKSKKFKKKAYVLGDTGVTKELDKANIQYLPIGPDPVPDKWREWVNELELDPEVGAVIVAFDQYVSFAKFTKAASYIRNPDNLFISPNADIKFVLGGDDILVPGTGIFISAIETVSGRKCEVLGKPGKYVLECIKQNYPNIDFNRCIMIGDLLGTDILLGTRHGIRTLLVLTGASSLEDVSENQRSSNEEHHLLVPDYYLPCLGDLLPFLQS